MLSTVLLHHKLSKSDLFPLIPPPPPTFSARSQAWDGLWKEINSAKIKNHPGPPAGLSPQDRKPRGHWLGMPSRAGRLYCDQR